MRGVGKFETKINLPNCVGPESFLKLIIPEPESFLDSNSEIFRSVDL